MVLISPLDAVTAAVDDMSWLSPRDRKYKRDAYKNASARPITPR
jgi:hypothetical protein